MKSFKETFLLKNTKRIKLVQFWSTWCGSCLDTKHLVDFGRENPNIEIYRMNVDENQPCSVKYSIVVLPTYIFFQYSKPILTLIGRQTKEDLNNAIRAKLVKISNSNFAKRKI